MKPKLLLRIASIIMFLHSIGHTIGHSGWKTTHDTSKQNVIREMTIHRFPFMGSVKSMGEYFEGYGYACTLALLLIAFLLWIVSAINTDLSRKIILAITVCLVFWGIDEMVYFFPAAAAFTLISAGLSLISFFKFKANIDI